jgi:hypothetical protein
MNVWWNAALRRLDDETCELKRMWLLPPIAGWLGRKMAQQLLDIAVRRGYKRTRLDTSPRQQQALRLYTKIGFQPIERYNDGPCEISWRSSCNVARAVSRNHLFCRGAGACAPAHGAACQRLHQRPLLFCHRRVLAERHGLRPGLPIDAALLDQLLREDGDARAYARALHYLSYRPRSGQEITARLQRDEWPPAVIERVLERLQRDGQ